MDTQKIASNIAERTNSMMRADKVSEVKDEVLLKLVGAGAIVEARTLWGYITSGNGAAQLLLGEADCINLTFDEIVLKVCSDDVLKLAIELVKQKR